MEVDNYNGKVLPNRSVKSDPWGTIDRSDVDVQKTFDSVEYQWGSIEDFGQFKQGYNTTSSQFGSTENLQWPGNQGKRKDFCVEFGKMTDNSTFQDVDYSNGFPLSLFNFTNDSDTGPFDVFDINVELEKKERRFGFSVMGGKDEGFRPRVDDIAQGSPADRAELQIGDEILEVNGKSLENCSHAEIISFIHRCIKTRSICLRVKRKKTTAGDTVSTIDHVQDAYMIAVEDEAKKRLEKLSATHDVTPVDMTKIAICSSIENLENSQHSDEIVSKNSVKCSSMPLNNKGQHIGNGHVEMMEMNGFSEKETSRKGKTKKDGRHSKSNSADMPLTENINQQNILGHSQNSLNHSSDNLYDGDDGFSDAYIHNSFQIEDLGPHKEMAVDCPDSFVATVKSPPRYPPPPSSVSQSSGRSSPSAPPTTPSKSLNNQHDQTRTDTTLTNAAAMVSNSIQNQPLSHEQLERLQKHQEELRKRREEENRIAKEQDFLRTSLRGSKKLQALESKKSPGVEGVINTAYEENDDDFDNTDDGFGSARTPSEKDRFMKKNIGIDDLFTSLRYMQNRLSAAEERDELSFLKNLFQNKQFQNAIDIHNKIIDVNTRSPPCKPICTNSVDLSNETLSTLQDTTAPYANDLVDLLCTPTFKNLLASHDQIAENESHAISVGPEDDFMDYPLQQFGEDTVKIVHLEKTNEPLGATVRNEGESVIIGRIVKGGTAEKSGLLHEGDEILEVNGIDMKGKNINDVSEMLANMSGTITFMIIPNSTEYTKQSPRDEEVMHIKALYNYDPEEDIYIPCRELGISFMKGDILHVLNQEDSNWWQAYREGEQEHQSLAGLIPSRSFQEIRESSKHTLGVENKENQKKGRSCSCGRKERKRKKKSAYKETTEEREDVLTYEEVELYYPQPNRKRPVVLIGPPNVGRHDLRQRLMESDYERFAAAVPHTSRPKDMHEVDGKDYHFVPRAIFEADILGNKFVEHGEYEKNLYGTSLDAIRQTINQGKICILNLHPESLEMLKNSDLKPYVVFVYPQNMEKLRQIQQKFGLDKITDDSLKDIIERAREMEDKYGHYFDFILVNADMDRAYEDLLGEINRLEVEPQWVPRQWIGN